LNWGGPDPLGQSCAHVAQNQPAPSRRHAGPVTAGPASPALVVDFLIIVHAVTIAVIVLIVGRAVPANIVRASHGSMSRGGLTGRGSKP
jgi:hypothetical protein